jgi:hemerythrin-like domain-containing protein
MRLRLARLKQEHRVIAHAGEVLAGHLDAILNGAVVPRAQVETAAATYLVYYGNHIAKEEEDVLPRAAAALTAGDWQAVAAAPPRESLQQ